ncbi:hypothetical protein [Hyphococcus sp.]|uniref:hypothetical protein n=1 Tax=Hyphococcus sp. TaxID=2038636 RepID=UPI0020857B0F|nr:MAG: hypothetical protein DHS20C04_30730 [Marinicaulis sp.]
MSMRGDVTVSLDGKDYRLLLDLGACDAIETRLEVENVFHAIPLLATKKAGPIMVFLEETAKAGKTPFDPDDLRGLDLGDACAALDKLMGAAFPAPEDEPVSAAAKDDPDVTPKKN